jgi:hypothetical protein
VESVFNLNEASLLWKHTGSFNLISSTEKTTPGFKTANERCTFILDGNTSTGYKLRHNSQKPKAMEGYSCA